MDEKLQAALGRKQLQLEEQDIAYTRVLNVLAGVLSGEIEPNRVLVNRTDRTWIVVEPGQSTGMPATINGLPVCVVGKPFSEYVPQCVDGEVIQPAA